MVRTRFAPSPTGYMHIGNLRTALYTYLMAKHNGGSFILRIEDTDQEREVKGSIDVIYNTLKIANLQHDEGPDVGGDYGPYVQSQRKNDYLKYAKQLIDEKKAYYCFCTQERLDTLKTTETSGASIMEYDRFCLGLSDEQVEKNLADGIPFVIRQVIPEGKTSYTDLVYGKISIDNSELDDQILIKSDGLPTYNFANVIDDHLMEISHVIRGNEYLSSAPKYNLLYEAFDWEVPIYMHMPLITNTKGEKLSKRKGDASFEDLMKEGYLPEAIINYIALLGWSPKENKEIFSLEELVENFDGSRISKAPSAFDKEKLAWMNGEYIKAMDSEDFYNYSKEKIQEAVKTEDLDLKKIADMVKTRIHTIFDIKEMVDFIDELPDYDIELYVHKKMKTNPENALVSLEKILPLIESVDEADFNENVLGDKLTELIKEMDVKGGLVYWPLRVAVSGKAFTPSGGIEILDLIGKEEGIKRIKIAIEKLS